MKNILIIPVLNEQESLGLVLSHLPKALFSDVIVVDNGSTDDSAQIALNHGSIVIKEEIRGYGRACLSGIAKANELGAEIISFCDGDYSDNPSDLKKLSSLMRSYDFVLGSRKRGNHEKGALLPQAIFGNWLSVNLMSILFGAHPYSDLGPMRMIKADKLASLEILKCK
jgi:glycosyltransferase involved in cell wall biosynthesis